MPEVRATPRFKPGLVGALVLSAIVLVGGVAAATHFLPRVTEWLHHPAAKAGDKHDKPPSHELVRDARGRPARPPTLRLSEDAARSLGIRPDRIVKVEAADKPRALPPLEGTLA